MFLLFGLSTRDRVVGTQARTCQVCGYTAPQTVVKRTTRFTLFFVPLFPVRPGRTYLECGHCRAFVPIDAAMAGRFTA
jgi:hypothetical protein